MSKESIPDEGKNKLEELKRTVNATIDRNADHIIEIARTLASTPELGFKEEKSASLVAEEFTRLGLLPKSGLALTGVRADASGKKGTGPQVAVLGELDALLCKSHPLANPQTGASHVCGHNGQIATMLGVAQGICASGALDELAGGVTFFAVPAEEYIDLDHRLSLRRDGKIEFLSGKSELIRLGEFDSIDMALMCHAWSGQTERKVEINGTGNGFLSRRVVFRGKAAHAGSSPHEGINALNAAAMAIMAINSRRETFREQDHVRVNLILTNGGELVNIVPDTVSMEMMIRAADLETVLRVSEQVEQAVHGAAQSVGATALIEDMPGYFPVSQCADLTSLVRDNAISLLSPEAVVQGGHRAGSTDAGDLSHILPIVHPMIGGVRGKVHTPGYEVADEEMLYVMPAKLLAMTVIDLLFDTAKVGQSIADRFVPKLSRAEYTELMRERFSREA